MSGFTAESFVSKLSKLSDSQQSIQTLSHWVQYHKKACGESAATWAAECLRAPPARQLLFVYLANDIMQNSKRKGNEFCNAYGAQLQAVLHGRGRAEPLRVTVTVQCTDLRSTVRGVL